MPSRAELNAALNVFRLWLEEDAAEAQRMVGRDFNPRTTTLPEVAELVGVARGLAEVPAMLQARIDALPDA